MPDTPPASIIIPTRARPGYLDVTLETVMPQAAEAGVEVIVVQDGADSASAGVAERHGARLVTLEPARGLNAGRNAGIEASSGDPVLFLDDDVRVPDGWLRAMLDGIAAAPGHELFGGPITAELEGGGPRACGRESPPISTLDLGPSDRDAAFVWGANMAVRRAALGRVGPFDEALAGRGDEEEWERRYRASGGRIRYLARAGVVHRRTASDARLSALARAAYALGRTARGNDTRKGAAPPVRAEVRVLAGCLWHTGRRRCAYGVVMAAHTLGRLRELVFERRHPRPIGPPSGGDRAPSEVDFVSGTSGQVWGVRATTRALARDVIADSAALAVAWPWRLGRAAANAPRRRVLVLAVERDDAPNLLADARRELARSRHDVAFAGTVVGGRGKFENLNALLERHAAQGHDWLLVLDDDVALPRDFLDRFLFLAERFGLRLAQPAHRHGSHAAWPVTRRRAGSLVRETGFVEIGPVVALHASTFDVLLPFPPLRFGWGLDAHWSAVARAHGWPIGIVDATPVRHGMRRIASSYSREDALTEARRFLEGRPYTPAVEAQRTMAVHRSLR